MYSIILPRQNSGGTPPKATTTSSKALPSSSCHGTRNDCEMPRLRKRGPPIAQKQKCGTGKSKGKAQREIIGGKSSGGWAPPTAQVNEAHNASEGATITLSNSVNTIVHDASGHNGATDNSSTGSRKDSNDVPMPASLNECITNVSCTTVETSAPAYPTISEVTPKLSHYKRKQILAARVVTVDRKNAFSRKRDGDERSSDAAAKQAKRRHVNRLIDVLKEGKNDSEQALVLEGVLQDPKVAHLARTIGFPPSEETEVALFQHRQQQEAIAKAYESKSSHRAQLDDDKNDFVEAHCMASARNANSKNPPSLNSQAKALPLPRSTAMKLIKKGIVRRAKAFSESVGFRWSSGSRSRKRYSKVMKEKRAALDEWIRSHHDVVQSPIANDTIQVYNPETEKKEPKPKLLLMVPVRELHNDLAQPEERGGFKYAYDERGKLLISDTMLRSLLPKELKRMTERHKQMCGCETCIVGRGMLRSLRAYRKSHVTCHKAQKGNVHRKPLIVMNRRCVFPLEKLDRPQYRMPSNLSSAPTLAGAVTPNGPASLELAKLVQTMKTVFQIKKSNQNPTKII